MCPCFHSPPWDFLRHIGTYTEVVGLLFHCSLRKQVISKTVILYKYKNSRGDLGRTTKTHRYVVGDAQSTMSNEVVVNEVVVRSLLNLNLRITVKGPS